MISRLFPDQGKPVFMPGKTIELLFVKSIDSFRTSVYNAYITNKRSNRVESKKMVTDMTDRRHHYKIVKPVRFFMFIVISIMILVFAGYGIIGAADAEAATVRTYAQVTISEGDSLWSIVERYNKDAHIDVQSVIYDIYEINDIDAADIQPGDKIFVPVY